MDLGIDELDYEEDELENVSVINSPQSKNIQGNETDENKNLSGFDDSYLQLDCPEEEDFEFNEQPAGSIAADTKDDEKGDEESNKSIPEKLPEKEERAPTNGSVGNNQFYKRRNKNKRFQRREGLTNYPVNGVGLKPWSPGFKIPLMSTPRLFYNNHVPNLFQPIPLLALNVTKPEQALFPIQALEKRFMDSQAFGSISPITRVNTHNLSQLRCKPVVNHLARYLNKERSNSQGKDRKIFAKNVGYKNVLQCKNHIKMGTHDQNSNGVNKTNPDGLKNNYQFSEIKHSQDSNNLGSTKHKAELNFLKDDEKKLLVLKKEARLKRFMQDDIVQRKIKLTDRDRDIDKETQNDFHLGVEYFKKMEEQKLARERLLSLKGRLRKQMEDQDDNETLPAKPDINKEWLLLKRNPFDASLGASSCIFETVIKLEKDEIKIKTEPVDDGSSCLSKTEQFLETEDKKLATPFKAPSVEFGACKNSSPVKFVRTVSKSFDELGFRKLQTAVDSGGEGNECSFSYSSGTLPVVAGNKRLCGTNDFPAQIESQLNGCIVKVLNIPPSTTTNDVLSLCSPVGIVKEVKLNFPKENSVVIRFAEPSCAENFFNLYHGQKMNDYFLNVIVV